MSKKKGLIIASILLIGGVGIGVAAFASSGFDYKKIMKIVEKFDENYSQYDAVNKLNFSGVTANFNLSVSEDDKVHLYYHSNEYENYVITNVDDTLTINHKYTKPWYDRWFTYSTTPQFNISVPLDTLNALSVKLTTGNIVIDGINNLNSFDVDNTTGGVKITNCNGIINSYIKVTTSDIEISDSNYTALSIKSTTGDITLDNVKTNDKLEIKLTTGNALLKDVDAKNVKAIITTGSINLDKLISDNIYLKNTSGNIKGTIKGLVTDYMITASSTSGNCNLNSTTTGTKTLYSKTTSGNINLSFVE